MPEERTGCFPSPRTISSRGRFPRVAAVWSILLGSLAACQANRSSSVLPPDADQALRAAAETLDDATALVFEATTTSDEVLESGPMVQYRSVVRVAIRRPDRMHARVEGDLADREAWYDGRRLTVHDRRLGAVAEYEVPEGSRHLDGMLDHVADEFDRTMPLADLVYADPYDVWTAGLESGFLLGRREMDERTCSHLALRTGWLDWQLWIDDNTDLPHRLVIIDRELPGQPKYAADFRSWVLAPSFGEDEFTPAIPEGTARVSMADLLAGVIGEER